MELRIVFCVLVFLCFISWSSFTPWEAWEDSYISVRKTHVSMSFIVYVLCLLFLITLCRICKKCFRIEKVEIRILNKYYLCVLMSHQLELLQGRERGAQNSNIIEPYPSVLCFFLCFIRWNVFLRREGRGSKKNKREEITDVLKSSAF